MQYEELRLTYRAAAWKFFILILFHLFLFYFCASLIFIGGRRQYAELRVTSRPAHCGLPLYPVPSPADGGYPAHELAAAHFVRYLRCGLC